MVALGTRRAGRVNITVLQFQELVERVELLEDRLSKLEKAPKKEVKNAKKK